MIPLTAPSPATQLEPSFIRSFRRRLIDWYRRHRRELPWRNTKDPYAIWISEIMLQQTQVATVIPYYERFLQAFPTVEDLANAPESQVLERWAGLGYYSRARSLRAAAQQIVERHGSEFPRDEAKILELPGIGRYTAGAIRSIAFDQKAPLLDGNVARVLTRVFALRGDPKSGPVSKRLWEIASILVPPRTASDFNQGLMELGALICSPRQPHCGRCPVRRLCHAYAAGLTDVLPESSPKRATVSVTLTAAGIHDPSGRLLLVRRTGERLMEGLWELPTIEYTEPVEPALRRSIEERTGQTITPGRRLGTVRHAITHRRLQVIVLSGRCSTPKMPARNADWMWWDPDEDPPALSGLAQKTIRLWRRSREW
ncbi:MAG: A/G-specific adenine glycosylase [Planctomycetota bacterium]